MKKKLIIIIAIVILFLIGGFYFYTQREDISLNSITKPDNLNFYTEKCEEDIDPWNSPKSGILNQSWKDNSALVVEGYVTTYCGGAKIYGDYFIEENDLTLEYEIKVGNEITHCICPTKVVYEISDIENKEYSIFLKSK